MKKINLPSTRAEAHELGAKKYFTGKPCKHGHISERYSGGKCIQCESIAAKRLYEIHRKSPDFLRSVSLKNKKIYSSNKEKIIRKVRAYALSNKLKINEGKARYRIANREYLRAAAKERYKKLMSEKPKEYWINKRNSTREYRARKVHAVGSHTIKDVSAMMEKQKGECNVCQKDIATGKPHAFHVDHIYPLSKGGRNSVDNLQLLCRSCNCSKRDKTPDEWKKFLCERI